MDKVECDESFLSDEDTRDCSNFLSANESVKQISQAAKNENSGLVSNFSQAQNAETKYIGENRNVETYLKSPSKEAKHAIKNDSAYPINVTEDICDEV
jgi:hypothetical protein